MLNRVLRYTPNGFEYEAGPRHAEKLLEEGLSLDGNCNTAATLGLKPLTEQLVKDEGLPTSGHTEFRGLAARRILRQQTASTFNYLPMRFVCLSVPRPIRQ